MMHNRYYRLFKELKELGLKRGMNLLVHSSLRRIGSEGSGGGPEAVLNILHELIGPEGTLLMPAISACVNPAQPVFHAEKTPSSVGYLTEYFRMQKNSLRSLHPVHSVAASGPGAHFFTDGHLETNTPWSPESPYGRIMRNNGWILFLGTSLRANSCYHALEIEALVPGLYEPDPVTLYTIDSKGNLHEKSHHWHAPKKDFYIDTEHMLHREGVLSYGRTGLGISRLVNAQAMRRMILPLLQKEPALMVVPQSVDNRFVWMP